MKKIIITYGLLSGALVTIFMLVGFSLFTKAEDFQMAELAGYASMIVALSTIFFGVRKYRDQNDGTITFGKAFGVGLLITLVASAIYVTGWMIYSANAGAGIMDAYFDKMVADIRESGKAADKIAKEIRDLNEMRVNYEKPLVKIGFTFIEIFPVGLVISLISAALLRKKE